MFLLGFVQFFCILSFPDCINFIDWSSISLNSFLSAHISCWILGWNFHLFYFLNPEFPFIFEKFLHLYLKLSIWWDFPLSAWKWFPMVLWSHIPTALKSASAKLNTGELLKCIFYCLFFLSMGNTLLPLACHIIFQWKLNTYIML